MHFMSECYILVDDIVKIMRLLMDVFGEKDDLNLFTITWTELTS